MVRNRGKGVVRDGSEQFGYYLGRYPGESGSGVFTQRRSTVTLYRGQFKLATFFILTLEYSEKLRKANLYFVEWHQYLLHRNVCSFV